MGNTPLLVIIIILLIIIATKLGVSFSWVWWILGGIGALGIIALILYLLLNAIAWLLDYFEKKKIKFESKNIYKIFLVIAGIPVVVAFILLMIAIIGF